jgi:hypothetical protein
MQMLAFTGTASCYEPKPLRLRIFAAAERIARLARRVRLRRPRRWPWAKEITAAIACLQALAPG